jgi:peptide/nickel transport system substrate-binding protein
MSSPETFQRRRIPGGWLVALLLLIVAAVVVVVIIGGSGDDEGSGAASEGTSTQAATTGGTLQAAALASPDPMDPQLTSPTYARVIRKNVYEPLVSYAAGTVDLEPKLATEWEVSDDGLVYTFTLRDGVTFHDGTPMDSDDVKASFDRASKVEGDRANMGSTYLVAVKEVRAPSPTTVEIELKAQTPLFLGNVPKIAILSSDDIEQHAEGGDLANKWFNENANGTGPWKLDEVKSGQSYTLSRNEDYWRDPPAGGYDKIVVRVIADSARQAQLLQRGELDLGSDMSIRDMVNADKSDEVKLVDDPVPNPTMTMIGSLNAGRAPLNDITLRRAIIAAFPYADMAEFYQGYGQPPTNLLPASYPGAKEFPDLEQNLDEARSLLEEAGYGEGGKQLKLRYVAFQGLEDTRQAGLLLQDALKEIGVDLEVEVLPFATFFEQIGDTKTAPDISPGYEAPETNDPFFWFNKLTGKTGFYNLTFTNTKELDDTISAGQATTDDAEREELIGKAQDLIVENAVIIPMAAFDSPGITGASVAGLERDLTELLYVPDFFPLNKVAE